MAIISHNKYAYYDYEIERTRTAGIVLRGYEAKALREHTVSLRESIIHIHDGELRLTNLHLPLYSCANPAQIGEYDPTRRRKLLVNKRELGRISALMDQGGVRLVPLKLHRTSRGLVKCEFGIGKKKKKIEKRAVIKNRDQDRQAKKAMRQWR